MLSLGFQLKVVILLLLAALGLRLAFNSLVPVLAMAAGVAWLLPRPWPYLLVGAVMSEFWSVEPLGAISGAVLLPGVVRLLTRRSEPELSGTYLTLIAGSIAGQLGWLIMAEYMQAWITMGSVISLGRNLPWLSLAQDWLSATVAVVAVVIWLLTRGAYVSSAQRRPYTISSMRF